MNASFVASLFTWNSALAWLTTFALHSTLLIGLVWILCRPVFRLSWSWQHTLWRVAVAGPVVTTTIFVCASDFAPLHRFTLEPTSAPTVLEAEDSVVVASSKDHRASLSDMTSAAVPELAERVYSEPSVESVVPVVAAKANAEVRPAIPTTTAVDSAALAREHAVIGVYPSTSSSAPRLAAALPTEAASVPASADSDPATRRLWGSLAVITAVLVGAMALIGTVVRLVRLLQLLGARQRLEHGPAREQLDHLCQLADIRSVVHLSECDGLSTPVALLGREICLPPDFADTVSVPLLRGALAHELAHIQRGDPWWMHIASFVQAAFFVQPLFRVARRELRDSAEFLCDDWAVAVTRDGLGLAQCLAQVATMQHRRQTHELLPAMASATRPLVDRVKRLLAEPEASVGRRHRAGQWAVVVTGLAVFLAAAPVVVHATGRSDSDDTDAASTDDKAPSTAKARRAKRQAERASRRASRAQERAERKQAALAEVDPQAAAELDLGAPETPTNQSLETLPPPPSREPVGERASLGGSGDSPVTAPATPSPSPKPVVASPPPMPAIVLPPLPPMEGVAELANIVATTVGTIAPTAASEGLALKGVAQEVETQQENVERAQHRVDELEGRNASKAELASARKELAQAQARLEKAQAKLDAQVEAFEKKMEASGKVIEEKLERWAEEFERDYGSKLEAWEHEHASQIEAQAEQWEAWGEQWAQWGESLARSMEEEVAQQERHMKRDVERNVREREREVRRQVERRRHGVERERERADRKRRAAEQERERADRERSQRKRGESDRTDDSSRL